MLSISLAEDGNKTAWETYIQRKEPAHHAYSWAWKDILTQTFGHQPYYFIARETAYSDGNKREIATSHLVPDESNATQGSVVGVLPLFEVHSLLFGRALISVPYLNAGGILADSEDIFLALLREAEKLGSERRVKYIELRHIQECLWASTILTLRSHKVAMKLWLPPVSDQLFRTFDTRLRSQIRRPSKDGVTTSSWPETLEDTFAINAFYSIFSRNMRDLGTPVYPKLLFSLVQKHFPKCCRIMVAWHGNEPVATALTLGLGDHLEIPWASSLRSYNKLSPNMLLYWEVIKSAVGDGYKVFDFGRSSVDSGTYRFKAQWGAKPEKLHWYYSKFSQGIPDVNAHHPKYRVMVSCWKHLPQCIANTLGPWLTRSLP